MYWDTWDQDKVGAATVTARKRTTGAIVSQMRWR